MPLPDTYRDYPLFVLMTVAYFIAAVSWLLSSDHQSIQITLAEQCCVTESCPVTNSLTSLPTVRDLVHDTTSGGAIISFRTSRKVTPKTLWEAVEAVQQSPVSLVVDDREFLSKPLN